MKWKIWKKSKLKCEMIWKIQKEITIRYGKYGGKNKNKLNSEKISKIWKKTQLNSEMIQIIWKKGNLNSGKIWKIWKKKS